MKYSSFRKIIMALTLTGLGLGGLPLAAQQVQHLTILQPGGLPGWPVMTGISQGTNGMKLTWDGPSGYYQVFQKSNSLTASWAALGKATNLVRTATVSQLYSNAFFRVSGPSPKYAGAKVCITCHLDVCRYATNTPHFSAFANLPNSKKTDPSCLVCHTVGYGLPTGFTYLTNSGIVSYTTNLAGVQCENCHGPAKNHADNPDDPTAIPQVDIAAQVCGGCHSVQAGGQKPTYEEWSSSGHSVVVPDALETMSENTNNIRTCGVCHSGSARLVMLYGVNPAVTQTKDYDVPQTCAVCHDPHSTNAGPFQVRNPLSSTNNFELTSADTATVDAFTAKYNANTNINLCAQCHNDRGASWSTTSRAPHHSVQYNFLLGSVGELLNGTAKFNPGPHTGLPSSADFSISGAFYLTNQCADCHMQDDSAGTANHTFSIASEDVCMNCHIVSPEILEEYDLTPAISNNVSVILTALNRWAGMQTNSLLATNGVVAWEYTSPGGLTWQTNSSGLVTSWSLDNPVNFTGPATAGQALIPRQVKQARFNLYLVLNDGSMGAHNPAFAMNLLSAAQIWMSQVLP